MKDIDIIKQLLNGYHLSTLELIRAKELAESITKELEKRAKKNCSGKHKTLDGLFECKDCSLLFRGKVIV